MLESHCVNWMQMRYEYWISSDSEHPSCDLNTSYWWSRYRGSVWRMEEQTGILLQIKDGVELKAHFNYMLSVPAALKPFFERVHLPNQSFPTCLKMAQYFSPTYLFLPNSLNHYEKEKNSCPVRQNIRSNPTPDFSICKSRSAGKRNRIESFAGTHGQWLWAWTNPMTCWIFAGKPCTGEFNSIRIYWGWNAMINIHNDREQNICELWLLHYNWQSINPPALRYSSRNEKQITLQMHPVQQILSLKLYLKELVKFSKVEKI